VRVEPETSFRFSPAGPRIKAGGLVITESTDMGIVGKLTALNNTDAYLLLTDADVLAGAKQNRVLNKSVLLAPMSKTILDVSCIERGRWQYSGKNFTSPENVVNPDLRKEKAETIARKKIRHQDIASDTQSRVWSHVSRKMTEMNYANETENYSSLLSFHMDSLAADFPVCEPEEDCNGLAVVAGSKVICADIFGTAEVYRYYFPMLRDSAFRMARTGSEAKAPDMHEAYYRVLDILDNFVNAGRHPDETYPGAGELRITENDLLVGFELLYDVELIHDVLFTK
jgi:hypothetical protein